MMRPLYSSGHGRSSGLALVLAFVVAGCAISTEQDLGSRAGMECVDDSPLCISQRQGALRQLMADKNRSWVRQPPSTGAYASGVRLFALKSKKKELSCDELSHGRREADAAPNVLRGPSGKHLTPAQISRGVMLAHEVSRELGNEFKRRCKNA
jgi:hypothetical protein